MKNLRRAPWKSAEAPLSCRESAKIVQAYLDGELDAKDSLMLEVHLESCRDCGLEAETYSAIKKTLHRQQQPVPTDALDRLRQFAATVSDQPQD